MTTVGIIGGLGPESTIDYYRRILETWAKDDPSTAPSIVIDSLDVALALRLVAADLPALTDYLASSLTRLAGAGAGFAAMTANTPHIVFDELAARSPIPIVSIVEVCAQEARRLGLRRLALLGTRFTMEGQFYPTVFARHGVEIVTPNEAERSWVHERYVGEMLKGDFRDGTRRDVVALVGRLRDDEGIDGVILGGTELTLLVSTPAVAGVPALDTTALHVAAIVERLRGHEACAFCAVAAGTTPASVVYEDALTLAFLDLRQFHAGHVLVIPRRHVRDLRDADDATVAAVTHGVARVARAVDRVFPSDGLSIWHSAGGGANQEVPHLHFHVHPRRHGDDVLRVYPAPPALPQRAVLEDWAGRLRAALADEASTPRPGSR